MTNKTLFKWKLIFMSLCNSLFSVSKLTLFKSPAISRGQGNVLLQQNNFTGPCVDRLNHLEQFSFLCQNTYTTSLCSISTCMKTFLRNNFCLFLACPKDLMFDLSSEISLQAFKIYSEVKYEIIYNFHEYLKY